MEELLALVAVALVLAIPISIVVLLVRVSALTRRVEGTEARLRELRSTTAVVEPPKADSEPAESAAPRPPPLPPHLPRPLAGLPIAKTAGEGSASPAAPIERATAPASSAAPPSSTRPKNIRPSEIDWERWLGIRGAAVVGGIALILAGFFLVQVAIKEGWLGPAARDTLALLVGASALAASGPLMQRGHRTLGESLGGAGAVLIYGAAWAASRLHGLVPEGLALLVMAATTGTALLFSLRRSAPILASFALVGGFATPLLLNTFSEGATTLFGYVLVLDVALLTIARVRRWVWMLPLAALGTTVIQITWILAHGRSFDPWVSTLVLSGFALAFSASRATSWGDSRNKGLVHITLLLVVFAPFVMTSVQTALQARHVGALPAPAEGLTLWSQAVLLAVLISCAAIAARRFESAADTVLAAIVAALTLAFKCLGLRVAYRGVAEAAERDGLWLQWAVSAVALAGLQLALCRVGARRSAPFAFALLSLLLAHPLSAATGLSQVPLPFALTIAALATIGIASSNFTEKRRLSGALIGGVAGLALMLHADAVHVGPLQYGSPLMIALPVLVALALACSWVRSDTARADRLGKFSDSLRAFAAFLVVAPLLLLGGRPGETSTLIHMVILLACGVTAAMTLGHVGRWTPIALVAQCGAAAASLLAWFDHTRGRGFTGDEFGLIIVTCLVCVAAPVGLAVARRGARRVDGRLAPAAAWAAILPAATLAFGPARVIENLLDTPSGFHAVLLSVSAITVLAGVALDRRNATAPAAGVLLAAGGALAGVSLARHTAAEWEVVATAIAGGSFAFFCGRARSTGPAGLGAALASATILVLLLLTFVVGVFPREDHYIPLQVTIDLALVAASLMVAAIGVRRLPPVEAVPRPLLVVTAIALLVTIFAWLNAVVLNHFATGSRIVIELERMQDRDLTLSLSWAVFGGSLLGVGFARRIAGLRWASLAVLIATVLKVFLYDLGALTGLARVGSFLGLAVCLLGVSLLYGRVLGRDFERRDGESDTLPPHDVDVPESDPTGVAPPRRD